MSQSTRAAEAFEDKPLIEVPNRIILMVAVIMISMMVFLDSTVANVALPHMKVSLGATNDSISWVLTSFIVASAVFTPMIGWLSDRVGSRHLFIGSAILFLLSSAACGAANSLPAMVIFRAIQGISAAIIGPMAQTILFDINKPSKHTGTMSLYGILVMIAPIFGPVVGGYMTESINWRWVFYINLPIGIPTLVVLWFLLPDRPHEARRLDLFGLVWIGIAIASFQILLDRGQHADWFDSWEIIIELLVAIGALWIYIVHHWHSSDPLLDKSLLRNRGFLHGLVMMSVFGISTYAQMAVLPVLYQGLYGYPVILAGLLMMPRGVGVLITSILAPFVIKVIDFRIPMFAGYLVTSWTFYLMTGWTVEMDAGTIALTGFLQGLGAGFLFAPMTVVAFSAVPPQQRPDGSAMLTLGRNVGSSFGISVIVAIVARQQQVAHADLAGQLTPGSLPAVDLPAVSSGFPGLTDLAALLADAELGRQAAMISFIDAFYVLMCVNLAMAALTLLIRKPKQLPGLAPAMGE